MPAADDALQTLEGALQLRPDDLRLQKKYARALMEAAQAPEAEQVYRRILVQLPTDMDMFLGLCGAFFVQGKLPEALVVAEEVLRQSVSRPDACVLYARVLLASGEAREAARQYALALDQDPTLADEELLFAIEAAEKERR
jgi:hypothetical protein